VSNKFQDELSSGGNIYDVLGEAADDEVTDAPPKTVNVPITEPVRTLRRKMNLVLGDAPSVGSNCAVRSVERSKANTPWADNITDQKAATIQLDMVNQYWEELNKRLREVPPLGERDLVLDMVNVEPCLDKLRTWCTEEGLEVPTSNEGQREWLELLLKGQDHALSYEALDKVLEFPGHNPVMLLGPLFQRLAEWYERIMVVLVPTLGVASGAVSVMEMIFLPRKEQGMFKQSLEPLNEFVPSAFHAALDRMCPVVRGTGKGDGEGEAVLSKEAVELMARLLPPEVRETPPVEDITIRHDHTVSAPAGNPWMPFPCSSPPTGMSMLLPSLPKTVRL